MAHAVKISTHWQKILQKTVERQIAGTGKELDVEAFVQLLCLLKVYGQVDQIDRKWLPWASRRGFMEAGHTS